MEAGASSMSPRLRAPALQCRLCLPSPPPHFRGDPLGDPGKPAQCCQSVLPGPSAGGGAGNQASGKTAQYRTRYTARKGSQWIQHSGSHLLWSECPPTLNKSTCWKPEPQRGTVVRQGLMGETAVPWATPGPRLRAPAPASHSQCTSPRDKAPRRPSPDAALDLGLPSVQNRETNNRASLTISPVPA